MRAEFTSQPSDGLIRVYEKGGLSQCSPFSAVVSVKFYSDHVYLFGAKGKFGSLAFMAVMGELMRLGAKKVRLEREGYHKIPFGKLLDKPLDKNAGLSLFEIDLSDDYFIKKYEKSKPKLKEA